VLSPSGWGPVQVQSCLDCTFEHLFSHGGVTLRMETDNVTPLCGPNVCAGGCTKDGMTVPPVDDKGNGFPYYARVDDVKADDIENALGNAALYLVPHCQHNGVVHVKNIRGSNSRVLVSLGQGGNATGVFDSGSLIENVVGTNDVPGKAQDPKPSLDTYDLIAPQFGAWWTATEFTAKTAGTWCWPSTLTDFWNPASAQKPQPQPTITHTNCPAR
jgi:hypothetical protein